MTKSSVIKPVRPAQHLPIKQEIYKLNDQYFHSRERVFVNEQKMSHSVNQNTGGFDIELPRLE